MFCSDCGNTKFVEYESDLTCDYCGLVAIGYCNFVCDYGQYTFADRENVYEPKIKRTKETDIFDQLEFPLGLTPAMIDTAKGILQECKFKGEGRRAAFVAASLYYASTKSIVEISDVMGIPNKCVYRAATEISESVVKYAPVVQNRQRVESHMLGRYIKKLYFLSPADETRLKCAVYKIQDKTDGVDALKPFKEDKVLATMIWMACEKMGIKEGTVKNVALALGAAVPTMKNIRLSIRDIV